MAIDKKISQLPSGAPAEAADEYVVARSGANYKLTLTNIAASMPPIGATTPNTGSFTTLTASGAITGSALLASNGIVLNKDISASNYSFPTDYNGLTVGPHTVSSGVSITVSAGQRWVVI